MFLGTIVLVPLLIGAFVVWRLRIGLNNLRRRVNLPSATKPEALVSSLSVRTVKGVAYRAETSRVGQALLNGEQAVRRSLTDFAAKAEIDKEI